MLHLDFNKNNNYRMRKQINIKVPTSWDDVTIKQFEQLQQINKEDPNADIDIVSILCGIDVETIEQLSLSNFANITSKLSFLSVPPKPCKPSKQLLINDRVINITMGANEMTTAQFFDFRNYINATIDKKTAHLLSCFMVPDGCSYGVGYNINDFIDWINENVSVVEAQAYTNFFMLTFLSFADAFLTYSQKQMKKMLKKKKSNKEMEIMMKPLKDIQLLITTIKNGGYLQ